jgi:hypothetical protein
VRDEVGYTLGTMKGFSHALEFDEEQRASVRVDMLSEKNAKSLAGGLAQLLMAAIDDEERTNDARFKLFTEMYLGTRRRIRLRLLRRCAARSSRPVCELQSTA